VFETGPIKIENSADNKKNGIHTLLKLKKTRKNILIITLNSIIFGALANNNVTLSKEPS
jgi:hypothetical protein